MKRITVKIIEYIGVLMSFIWSPHVSLCLSKIRNRIYTGYVRRRFGAFGRSIIIWHPYTLIGLKNIHVGDNTILEKDIQLTARSVNASSPYIKIGNGCLIRKGSHITAIESITIGDNLLTGTNIYITDNSHGMTDYASLHTPPTNREIISKGRVIIGNNVWIGNNVCIMPGVTIGDGVVIGANSIVTHDIPAYSVAAGIPAKKIN